MSASSRSRLASTLLVAVCQAGLAAAQETPPVPEPVPAKGEVDWEGHRDHVLAGAEELSWLDIGWIPQLGQAVLATANEPRPIFLWAMNGHPLGCT